VIFVNFSMSLTSGEPARALQERGAQEKGCTGIRPHALLPVLVYAGPSSYSRRIRYGVPCVARRIGNVHKD
jgi:hypothetical protein